MAKWTLILLSLLCITKPLFCQHDTLNAPRTNASRILLVSAGNAAFYTGSFIALNKAWYSEYERTRFHFFDDNPEWNQVDKAGHVWSTYHVSRLSAGLWKWTGMNNTSAAVAGGLSGMVYQSIIELQDAYSAAWGFSWGDVGANVVGAGLFVLQDIKWKEQKIQVKMGYHPYNYPSPLKSRRNELFGSSSVERVLKDYNSQTYWISGNLSALTHNERIPSWLNVAVGYSARGMYGGRTNYWTDDEGSIFDYRNTRRSRQFYLAPDIDLSRLRVKSKVLKSVLSVVNSLRIPLPALEIGDEGVGLRLR